MQAYFMAFLCIVVVTGFMGSWFSLLFSFTSSLPFI